MSKLGFGIIVFGLIVFVAAVFALNESLSSGLCENKVQQEVVSPNGQFKAVIFKRECGGTAAGTQLSLMTASASLPNKSGNVLVQESGTLKVSWQTDNGLVVRGAERASKKEQEIWIPHLPLWQNVKLSYKQ